MSDHQDPVRFTIGVGVTIGLLAIAGVSVFSAREYSASPPSLIAAHDRSVEGQELEHCRTITPEQYASDDDCHQAWAGQRQRFFGLNQQGSKTPITNVPTSPSQTSEPTPGAAIPGDAPHPSAASPQKD